MMRGSLTPLSRAKVTKSSSPMLVASAFMLMTHQPRLTAMIDRAGSVDW